MDADLDLLQHNQHHLLHSKDITCHTCSPLQCLSLLLPRLEILSDLLSDDEVAQRRVLDKYYLPNAKLTSPLISVQGIENVKKYVQIC